MNSGVYKITNTVTGETYVGATANLTFRVCVSFKMLAWIREWGREHGYTTLSDACRALLEIAMAMDKAQPTGVSPYPPPATPGRDADAAKLATGSRVLLGGTVRHVEDGRALVRWDDSDVWPGPCWRSDIYAFVPLHPTHWMPLPEPPKT